MGLRWAGDKKLQATGRKLGARALVARSWLPRQERGGSGAAVSSRHEQREDDACSLQNHSLLTSKNISSTELQFSLQDPYSFLSSPLPLRNTPVVALAG